MKPLLGKQVLAGAWDREDTLETFSLPSEKGATLSSSRCLPGQKALSTYQSLQQTFLRPFSYLLFIGKEPIFTEQTLANQPGP